MYGTRFFVVISTLIALPINGMPSHGVGDRYGEYDKGYQTGDYSRHQHGAELFEGDIMMDERLHHAVFGGRSRRSALRDNTKDVLWPNGIIYYQIEKHFSLRSRKLLSKVMKQYEARTCIRFKNRTNEKDFVVFSSAGRGCSSFIGRIGGPQTINLSPGCLSRGRFEHELMHSLGFVHEQSRPDRDQYVHINFANINKKHWKDFQKYNLHEVTNLDEEFNFASIMLYRNKAFSTNEKDTLKAIGDTTLKFGQRKQFSIGDVREINKLYKCDKYLEDPNNDGLIKDVVIMAS